MNSDAREVRTEDAFDIAAMSRWLATHAAPEFASDLLKDNQTHLEPQVRQFTGGASNLTYLLRYPTRDLILRRPPSGTKAAGAHDMGREYRVQAALRPHWSLVPRMVAYCDAAAVIGSPFYVMERLNGPVPRRDLPTEVKLDPDGAKALCVNFIDTLVSLHALDPADVDLAVLDRGPGYVRRQVEGWSQRCRRAMDAKLVAELGDLEPVMSWLDANQPQDVARVVIHNDFRLDNVVLNPDDPTRIIGVLDWEMATVGDPLMDLGGAMAYWVQADDDPAFAGFRRQPSHLPGMLTRRQFVETYCQKANLTLSEEQWRFYEVFGLFRLAVIAVQIYYRYAHGQTTNQAYAVFGPATAMLRRRCLDLMS